MLCQIQRRFTRVPFKLHTAILGFPPVRRLTRPCVIPATCYYFQVPQGQGHQLRGNAKISIVSPDFPNNVLGEPLCRAQPNCYAAL